MVFDDEDYFAIFRRKKHNPKMAIVKYYLIVIPLQRLRQHLFISLLFLAILVFVVTMLQANVFFNPLLSTMVSEPILVDIDDSGMVVRDDARLLDDDDDDALVDDTETSSQLKILLENGPLGVKNNRKPSKPISNPTQKSTSTAKQENNYKFDENRMQKLFSQRQEQTTQTCLKYYNYGPNISFIPYREVSYRFIYVDDVHKILYCAVPKVASTNWKRMFMLLGSNGNSTFADLEMDEVHEGNATWPYIKPLKYYTPGEVSQRILNYTKIMWVRDPLHRLVSAWRSKFTKNNTFYNEVYGSYIIKKYRPGATEAEVKAGYPVSLKEFFFYLRDEGLVRGDVHWSHYTSHCLSCIIPYDYIGKLEDMSYEATYVLRKATGDHTFQFPLMSERHTGAPSTVDGDYMAAIKELPLDLLQYVALEFKIDYEMFGYAMPRFFDK